MTAVSLLGHRHGQCDSALAALDSIADNPHLANYPYHASTRADLLRRLGHTQAAAQAYQAALSLATNTTERDFLAQRLAEVTDQITAPVLTSTAEHTYAVAYQPAWRVAGWCLWTAQPQVGGTVVASTTTD